jgi:hypothetical protein
LLVGVGKGVPGQRAGWGEKARTVLLPRQQIDPRQEPIPKTGIPKNKSRIRGMFFNPKYDHQFTTKSPQSHHKFTIKKPRSPTRFPQNPQQKHKKLPLRKKRFDFGEGSLNGYRFLR